MVCGGTYDFSQQGRGRLSGERIYKPAHAPYKNLIKTCRLSGTTMYKPTHAPYKKLIETYRARGAAQASWTIETLLQNMIVDIALQKKQLQV